MGENDLIKKSESLTVVLEAIEALRLGCPKNGYTDRLLGAVYESVAKRMNSLPPTVIRCRDCKWWEKEDKSLQGRCALLQMYPPPAWFCGNAQKKDEENEK